MSTFRSGAVQMNTQGDKDINLEKADKLIDEAASLGAQMVGLPEMFNILGPEDYLQDGAEHIPGRTSEFLANKARQHGIYIHGGSIPEIIEEEQKVGNTTLVFDPEGNEIAKYRKIHLFDIDVTGQATFKESDKFVFGDNMVTFETEHSNFGLTICYDVRFPEMFRQLVDDGATVFTVPAAFTVNTG